jgi:hypothetical protein
MDMDRRKIEESAAALAKENKLWRDPAARARFQDEIGLAPIKTGNGLDVEAQHQSGQTSEYHALFMQWASHQP